jgi:hypothetical protein
MNDPFVRGPLFVVHNIYFDSISFYFILTKYVPKLGVMVCTIIHCAVFFISYIAYNGVYLLGITRYNYQCIHFEKHKCCIVSCRKCNTKARICIFQWDFPFHFNGTFATPLQIDERNDGMALKFNK